MHLLVPTFILAFAVYTDLRARSIYNKFIIISTVLALANVLYFFGWSGLQSGLLGMGLAFLIGFPLFMAKILGGGDVKLLALVGLMTAPAAILNIIVLSFVWASVIGIIYAVVNGSARKMVTNTVGILKGLPRETIDVHRLPFAVAIFMAWMSHLVMQNHGGRLW